MLHQSFSARAKDELPAQTCPTAFPRRKRLVRPSCRSHSVPPRTSTRTGPWTGQLPPPAVLRDPPASFRKTFSPRHLDTGRSAVCTGETRPSPRCVTQSQHAGALMTPHAHTRTWAARALEVLRFWAWPRESAQLGSASSTTSPGLLHYTARREAHSNRHTNSPRNAGVLAKIPCTHHHFQSFCNKRLVLSESGLKHSNVAGVHAYLSTHGLTLMSSCP